MPRYFWLIGPSFLTAQLTVSPAQIAFAETLGAAADLRIPPRMQVNYASDGNGYRGSIGLEGFFPIFQSPGRDLTYLTGNLHLNSLNHLGGNLLLGHRVLMPSGNYFLGGYVAYDVRDTGSTTFQQLGLGLEVVAEDWDIHLNGYLPLGNSRQFVASSTLGTLPENHITDLFFQGNQLLITTGGGQLIQIDRYEEAMAGVDLEAGGRLLRFGNGGDLRLYGGVYQYFGAQSRSTTGVKGRLAINPTPNLNLGVGVQHDGLFGTRVFFGAGLTLSPANYPQVDSVDNIPTWSRASESPTRQSQIIIEQQTETRLIQSNQPRQTVPAIEPQTGQVYTFRHVNPQTGNVANSGTIESPKDRVSNTVGIAQPGDIIYVQSGHAGNGFTVPDNVQVLSIGPQQQINTQFGRVTLPGSNAGLGQRPTIDGSISLGNNSVLSGFVVDALGNDGLLLTNVQNVSVRDNAVHHARDGTD
jgi:hypothetical protein